MTGFVRKFRKYRSDGPEYVWNRYERRSSEKRPQSERSLTMPQAKQTSKQKRRSKALPILGAAGLSLSLASTASAVPGGPAVNLPTSGNGDGNQVFLGEEEISDVSLATFYVFDKEGGNGTSSMVQLVGRGCGGCHGCGGCGHGGGCHAGGGCGGCHHGCGCHGCGGCRHGCGGCGCVSFGIGCGGCSWGGCGGCGGGGWCWWRGRLIWCGW